LLHDRGVCVFFFPFFSFFSFLWNERERVSASPFAAESPIDPDRS
jgi:hypothetical protein